MPRQLLPAADMPPHQVCAAVGQLRTHAPQQTAAWFDHQTSCNPRRSPVTIVRAATMLGEDEELLSDFWQMKWSRKSLWIWRYKPATLVALAGRRK
jgi:hypothetical protein